ncbi:MAG TPA: molybdopterin molybdotransferase MoeA [Candidatus Acidoferrales bacterium]|nr:molybdopterin molybdotransferase MoeA [Candidatus Acidoferrales bacterium]
MPERLLAPQQALVAYFARVAVTRPAIERVALESAAGRVLAEAIAADGDYPAVRRSAMDGFALDSRAAPATFEIAGEVRMGRAGADRVEAGKAMRVPTGGAVPEGADAVVPIEDAVVTGTAVTVRERIDTGENVIPAGADMRRGEPLLPAGLRLGARHLGLLATVGLASVNVYRRPVVAVISSGDELVAVDAPLRPGEVRDSNRYVVAASLEAMGAQARHYPTLVDEDEAFRAALTSALDECDAVVLTGGSSVGDRDRLPAAVAAVGAPGVVVHGLRVKPGKPTLLGARGGKPVIGLPGNPSSALMMLEAVGAPVVASLTGENFAPVPPVTARLAEAVRGRQGWTWYVPVALRNEAGTLVAQPLALRSFSVSLTVRAGGYVVIGERDVERPADSSVAVHRFLGG